MKEKKFQAKLNKLSVKAKSKNRVCCWVDCKENAINSHILQKNGILNEITCNGHIIVSKTDFFKPELFHFKSSGINKTYTFKGFCRDHDKSIFSPIEDNEIDFEDYQSQLLFAYRTVLNEKRKKEVLIDWNNLQMHDKDIGDFVDKDLLKQLNEQNRLAIRDLEHYESMIVDDLENGKSENFIFNVRYLSRLEICLASHFTYETTRERAEHIENTGNDLELLTDIFICLFPLEEESVLLMGYLNSKEDICGEYVSNFFDIEESELLYELSNLMLNRCEEWACSEKFYNQHIKDREDEIIKIFQEAATSYDEDKKNDLNLFN